MLSFILIPKKMHLHALTVVYIPAQIFVTFGLVGDEYTDWIMYVLQNISYPALIGGFSLGKCCQVESSYFNLTT